TAPSLTESYTLSLHDALPIFSRIRRIRDNCLERFIILMLRISKRVTMGDTELGEVNIVEEHIDSRQVIGRPVQFLTVETHANIRSEEHTSELQSRFDLVCRLL